MLYKLSSSNIETLRKMPETGMGYQLIKTIGKIYNKDQFIVLNGKLAIDFEALKYRMVLKTIIGDDFIKAINTSKEIDLNIMGLVTKNKIIGNFVQEDEILNKKSAKDNSKEDANGDELFVRLSAFEDDIRVDKQNMCLLAGSYTTTASDALRCKAEKDSPVERYALLNDLEIKWAFYVQPTNRNELQRGFVQEAFGKRGGGREAYFEKGTSNRTFITQSEW
jgi:hypothetical protein